MKLQPRLHPPLTGGYVERDAAARSSDDQLDELWAAETTRILPLRSGEIALQSLSDTAASLHFVRTLGSRDPEARYLGRLAEAAIFSLDTSDGVPDSLDAIQPPAGWHSPLTCGALLSPGDAELMAEALALKAWHDSSPYSNRTGAPTTPEFGGWARLDESGVEHFPRTDPVVIVRVEHEDRLLLGSNLLWETGRFSLLAGFIEAGESAEQAVEREIWEEAQLRVSDIRYVTSQPWPFPRSFMMGFSARPAPGADPTAVQPDPTELSELRWFTRSELENPPAGITLPGKLSIARWLIDRWVAEGR